MPCGGYVRPCAVFGFWPYHCELKPAEVVSAQFRARMGCRWLEASMPMISVVAVPPSVIEPEKRNATGWLLAPYVVPEKRNATGWLLAPYVASTMPGCEPSVRPN